MGKWRRLNYVIIVEGIDLPEVNITCRSGHTWLHHEEDRAFLVITFNK